MNVWNQDKLFEITPWNEYDMTKNVFLLVLGLVLLMTVCPVEASADTVGELYEQAEQRYLNFDNEGAIELLRKVLRKDPDHRKAKELLRELGAKIPESSKQKTSPADTVPASVSEPEADTETEIDTGEIVKEKDIPDIDTVDSEGMKEPKNVTSETEEKPVADSSQIKSDEGDTEPAGERNRELPVVLLPNLGQVDTGNIQPTGDTEPLAPDREISVSQENEEPPPALSDLSNPGEGETAPETTGGKPATTVAILPEIEVRASPSSERSNPNLILPGSGGQSSLDPESIGPRNINTADSSDLTRYIADPLVNQILSERETDGYFLSWSDFKDRIQIEEDQLQAIREQFRLAIPVVDINTASREQLAKLPFLTSEMASNIVNFRFTYGRYNSVEELQDVPNIEKSTLDQVREFLEAR